MIELYDVIGKVLEDPTFAGQLVAAPAQVLRAAGVEPTNEILNALQGLDASTVSDLARSFLEPRAFTG